MSPFGTTPQREGVYVEVNRSLRIGPTESGSPSISCRRVEVPRGVSVFTVVRLARFAYMGCSHTTNEHTPALHFPLLSNLAKHMKKYTLQRTGVEFYREQLISSNTGF